MNTHIKPRAAHLVGSIGLDTVEDVFSVVGKTLGSWLRRIPDGEIGGRKIWITWQYPLLRASPFLAPDPSGAVRPTNKFPLLTLADGVRSQDVHFGELNYAREARASYFDFVDARDKGLVPKEARFQVCLPTPFAVVSSVVVPDALAIVEAAYEKAMIEEVGRLCRHIPHRDLCIQWDVCNEMVIWDGQKSAAVPYDNEPRPALVKRIDRLAACVPADVELGFHLCYGDFGGKHFVEPNDATAMVELANAIVASCPRPITYMHLPIPMAWTDDRHYAPLQNLKIPPATELYLGLVHVQDGVTGAGNRLNIAKKFVGVAGVATECGMARARTEDTVRSLLKIHSDLLSAQ